MVMATALLVSMGKEDESSSGGTDTSDRGPAAWEEMARSELIPEIGWLDVLPEEGWWCTHLCPSTARWAWTFPPPHPGAEWSSVQRIPPAGQSTAAESRLAPSPRDRTHLLCFRAGSDTFHVQAPPPLHRVVLHRSWEQESHHGRQGAPSRQDEHRILQLHPKKSQTQNTETRLNAGTFVFYKTNCFQ